ncbi:MAG: cdhA 1 [Modestobacter sp.]|jgi:carbon-monoxide dehydrogenase large subunit|nr:cdhA 1 [Modestobacter sp.]
MACAQTTPTVESTKSQASQAWVGRTIPRVEDPPLLCGQGTFVADIAAGDNCLYAAFIRSSVASGRLVSVTAPPGVHLVVAADLTAKPIRPLLLRPEYVPIDMPILADEVVRFVGEPVAAVFGRTQAEAEDAAEQVQVEIDRLPAVVSVADALADGAPLVHPVHFPTDPNVAIDARRETDGFHAAMKAADRRISIQVSCGRQSAMPMEARASHVSIDRSTGRITLTTTAQMPHVIRTGLCDSLGIPEDQLRVVVPDVGGAFGAKQPLAREDVVLIHVARQLGRSVAWIETREENFLAAWHSREQVYQLTGGFSTDGTLLCLQSEITSDVGAYSCYPVTFGVEALMAMNELPGPYACPEYSGHSRAILTNKCPVAPYRGVARPVLTMAMERLMEVAAAELGLGRVEIRLKNVVKEYPHRQATGFVIDPSSHVEALEQAVAATDFDAHARRKEEAAKHGRLLGIGMSVFSESSGFGTSAFAERKMAITPGYEKVQMSFDPSGNVVLRIGASPHGQGLRTTLSQIVADELGVDPSRVRVIHSDTDATPYGWGTFASRSLVIAGGASKLAGAKLREQIKAIAASMLECDARDIRLRDGNAEVTGTSVRVSIDEIARLAHHNSQLLPEGLDVGLDATATYDPKGTFSNSVHVAEVEVDPATGQTTILRYLVIEDAGVMVNPQIVEGQIRGGVAQGIGNALYEELLYDERGVLTTTSLLDFLPPTMAEVPTIEIQHLETISDFTVTGAKGVGEGGTMGAPAAILNAINDALASTGGAVTHVPATPQRVREAIRQAQRGKEESA